MISECDFKFRGKTIAGFRCQNVAWCIPSEHSCNKLSNCPDNSDESSAYCNSKYLHNYESSAWPTAIVSTYITYESGDYCNSKYESSAYMQCNDK